MRFRPFFWPSGPRFIQELPSASHGFFDPILAYVRATGERVTNNPFVGTVLPVNEPGKLSYSVAIVGEYDPWRPGEKTLGPTFAYHNRPNPPEFVIMRYTILKLPNNPLELHMTWSPSNGDKEEMAVLNIHAATKRQQFAAIPILLDCFGKLKIKRGRPEGVAIDPEDFERMKRDAKFYREQRYTWEDIADKLAVDPKSLRKYKKKWGIK